MDAGSVETTLRDDYSRWLEIFESGSGDPGWDDGININLVRNHIIYGRRMLEKEAEGRLFFDFPAEYYLAVPPEAPKDWFSHDRDAWFVDDADKVFGRSWAGGFPEALREALASD